MARGRDPALPLYAGDLLSDEKFQDLPRALRGCVVLLWCVAWKQGPIEEAHLPRICRQIDASENELRTLLGTFFGLDADGHWVSARLEKERSEREELRGKRAAAGASGAARRWPADGKRIANGVAKASANGTPSASASASASVSSASSRDDDGGGGTSGASPSGLRGVPTGVRTPGVAS